MERLYIAKYKDGAITVNWYEIIGNLDGHITYQDGKTILPVREKCLDQIDFYENRIYSLSRDRAKELLTTKLVLKVKSLREEANQLDDAIANYWGEVK